MNCDCLRDPLLVQQLVSERVELPLPEADRIRRGVEEHAEAFAGGPDPRVLQRLGDKCGNRHSAVLDGHSGEQAVELRATIKTTGQRQL